MLYTMKRLLKVAKENWFAVLVFSICSYDIMKAIIEEVERLGTPVILEIHPDEVTYLNDEFVTMVRAYVYASRLPIAIHLDHGSTIEDVLRATRNGYPSMMADTSLRSLDDNVQITRKVVTLAHAVNISVEAEFEMIGNNSSTGGGAKTIIYTGPDQAKIFVKEAGVDILAVAIGTAHGLYPKNRTPKSNIDLLKELSQQIDLPFVLHSGSGNPDIEVSEAVKCGVTKVNLSSGLRSVFLNALREILSRNSSIYEPNTICPAANKKVQEVIEHKMGILNIAGKASLY